MPMHPHPLRSAAALALLLAALPFSASFAQTPRGPQSLPPSKSTPTADTPARPRNIPYVSIMGEDGKQRNYETNAIPLLYNRACFGWRMYLGGPNRTVALTEVLTTSQPAEQVIAGPETEVSADKTKATTHMREVVQDGVLQRSWCIIPGDPAGTYTYNITIDGEPRGEFVFCAIEIPDQNPNTDPRDLNCPNKFNAVERARPPVNRKAS